MTFPEAAQVCRRACARQGVPSLSDELVAYVGLVDLHARRVAVAAELDDRKTVEHAMRCFNRFSVALAKNDHMAHKVLRAARAFMKEAADGT